jgi:predicted RNA-binding protein YlqC (UPF0109 family)
MSDFDPNRIDDEFDDEFDDDEFDDDEIGAEGNRIVGARARAVVEYVARQLADDPDAVDVSVSERRGEVSLLVHANPDDLGRLIGRRGRVIQAIRQVTRAAGASEGIRVSVDIAE